jgi:hypothetical protein
MNERTNELRKIRRNENYLKLRKIGFSAKQATKMKNWSRNCIKEMEQLHKIVDRQRRNSVYGITHEAVDKYIGKETNNETKNNR